MNDDPPATVRWTLSPLKVPDLPPSILIPEAGLTLGRDIANDVAVPPSLYPGVSARHARLRREGKRLVIEDLDSKNGTLIAGQAVERHVLRHGDVFILGAGGPRFAVLSSAGSEETMEIPRHLLEQVAEGHSIGADTLQIVRERLGIPEGTGVTEMVQSRTRRNTLIIALLAVTLVAGGIAAFRRLTHKGEEVVESLQRSHEALQRRIDRQLAEAVLEQRRAWDRHGQRLEDARAAWESDKAALEDERTRVLADIRRLEDDERSAAGELAELRGRLEETSQALEKYNPVAIEEARLGTVSRVEQAVVLIEADLLFKNQKTKKTLYFNSREDGTTDPNFEGRGTPVMTESSGSGFCVHPDGWIITNAHVVYKKGDEDEPIEISPEFTLVPELRLSVVFSGSSERHPATLVKWAGEDKDDLALVKIESFEGMGYLPDFDLSAAIPPRGADVYLIGFPLGKKALQQGDTMIASTFRGIVSRQVEGFLQVDAAVHPGASGGPLIDAQGNVLGVVTAMQAVDLVSGSSAIGYIIPIAAAATIWPPPE